MFWRLALGYVVIVALVVAVALKYVDRSGTFGWAEYGSVMQAVVALLTLGLAGFATVYFPEQAERRRKHAESAHTAIRLSEMMQQPVFYTKMVAPSWEIAFKWLYWRGEDADDYRRKVVWGLVMVGHDTYRPFTEPGLASAQDYQNIIRFPDHFMPYHSGQGAAEPGDGVKVDELSEYMVLNIWIRFWCHLSTLLKLDMVDGGLARSLFAENYSYWRPFMRELRLVAAMLKAFEAQSAGRHLDACGGSDNPLHELEFLEAQLCPTDGSCGAEGWRASFHAYDGRAAQIAAETWTRHYRLQRGQA